MNGELAEQHFAQRKEWFRKFRDAKPILNGHQNADYPRYCDLCATIIAGNETIAPVEHHAAGEMDVCESCLAVWTRVLDASESDRVDLLETFARAEKETVQQICDVERNKKCCVCEIFPAKFVPVCSSVCRHLSPSVFRHSFSFFVECVAHWTRLARRFLWRMQPLVPLSQGAAGQRPVLPHDCCRLHRLAGENTLEHDRGRGKRACTKR